MADVEQTQSLSILGEDTVFEGEIKSAGAVALLGKFSGGIVSKGDVSVQRSSVCNVDGFSANSIVVLGEVNGDIHALQEVDMKSGSKIRGNVQAAQIRIDDNVDFEGRVTMLKDQREADIFSYSSADLRSLLSKSDGKSKS